MKSRSSKKDSDGGDELLAAELDVRFAYLSAPAIDLPLAKYLSAITPRTSVRPSSAGTGVGQRLRARRRRGPATVRCPLLRE